MAYNFALFKGKRQTLNTCYTLATLKFALQKVDQKTAENHNAITIYFIIYNSKGELLFLLFEKHFMVSEEDS